MMEQGLGTPDGLYLRRTLVQQQGQHLSEILLDLLFFLNLPKYGLFEI
jgi:hypothetical protein